MNLIVDVNLGKSVDSFLKNLQSGVTCIRDINPKMSDDDILKLAIKTSSVVVTMDKDFGQLIYKHSMGNCGVLLLRLEDETASEKIKVLSKILSQYSSQMPNNFCVYQNGRLRVRKN